MPSLNFQKRFVPAIESGEKRQTIREDTPHWRKLKVGDKLFLFTGLRTNNCKRLFMDELNNRIKLGKSSLTEKDIKFLQHEVRGYDEFIPYVNCKNILNIYISDSYSVYLAEIPLHLYQLNKFARDDGFDKITDMFNFFKTTYGLPFRGLLIKW